MQIIIVLIKIQVILIPHTDKIKNVKIFLIEDNIFIK